VTRFHKQLKKLCHVFAIVTRFAQMSRACFFGLVTFLPNCDTFLAFFQIFNFSYFSHFIMLKITVNSNILQKITFFKIFNFSCFPYRLNLLVNSKDHEFTIKITKWLLSSMRLKLKLTVNCLSLISFESSIRKKYKFSSSMGILHISTKLQGVFAKRYVE